VAGAGQYTIDIIGGVIGSNRIYGNSSNPNGTVVDTSSPSGNTLNISGTPSLGNSNKLAFGGFTNVGGVDANGNTFNLNSPTSNGIFSFVVGGSATTGNSNANQVNINAGATVTTLHGGYVDTSTGSATGNQVNINPGAAGAHVTLINGGRCRTGANANQVTINASATVATVATIHGGRTDTGNATGNQVTIQDSATVTYVYGGYVDTSTGSATGNQVTIKDNASVGGFLFGGAAPKAF
jgi:hypothetical protein